MNAQRILSLLLLFLAIACVVLIVIIELPTAPAVKSAPENSTAELKGSSVTTLQDGRLLISGGTGDDQTPRPLVQVFKDGSVITVQPLLIARSHHASVTLKDGSVLVMGGSTASGATAETESYDPKTDEWHKQASMANRRMDHTATLLPDGRVLVAGGSGSAAAGKSVEIYDPKKNLFSDAGQLKMARASHAAGISQGGNVIIRGGIDPNGKEVGTTEVFDPVKGVSTLDQTTVRRTDPRANEMSLFSLFAYIKNYWMPAEGGSR